MTEPPHAESAPPWHVVVPVKGGVRAKSRLHPPHGVDRTELALAFAQDCLAAVTSGMPRGRVLVVTSDPSVAVLAARLGARVVTDPGEGLNAAVAAGRDRALAVGGPGTAVAALLGDLPALRPGDLGAALGAAAAYPLAVVPDASGTGTVLLAAVDGRRLEPRFGAGSATRHGAAGHVRLDLDLPGLRLDVDDDADLGRAITIGVGPATRAVLRLATTLPGMQATVHTFDDATGAGSVLLDDGREAAFTGEVFAASALRHLRPGQRLSIELADRVVTRLWIVGIGDDQRIG